MTNPLCPKTERERDEALARLATAESLNTRYEAMLKSVRTHLTSGHPYSRKALEDLRLRIDEALAPDAGTEKTDG